jgi:hypothetical protein
MQVPEVPEVVDPRPSTTEEMKIACNSSSFLLLKNIEVYEYHILTFALREKFSSLPRKAYTYFTTIFCRSLAFALKSNRKKRSLETVPSRGAKCGKCLLSECDEDPLGIAGIGEPTDRAAERLGDGACLLVRLDKTSDFFLFLNVLI